LLSQITQNVVSFGTSIESLGWPWSSDFHNQIVKSYLGFQIKSISDTLYRFTSHLEKSYIYIYIYIYMTNISRLSFK
jgi:hypothetical protein